MYVLGPARSIGSCTSKLFTLSRRSSPPPYCTSSTTPNPPIVAPVSYGYFMGHCFQFYIGMQDVLLTTSKTAAPCRYRYIIIYIYAAVEETERRMKKMAIINKQTKLFLGLIRIQYKDPVDIFLFLFFFFATIDNFE